MCGRISLPGGYETYGAVESKAEPLIRKALELDPLETYAADLLARVARVLGKNDRAFEVLKRMDQLNPKNPRTICGIAECHMMARDFEKAQEYLDLGLRVNPREPLLRINQGILYALTGRSQEAESVLSDLQ